MTYVINPDGTITTVEADYDRNGNLKPKINCELLKEQVVNYNPNIAPEGRKVKPKSCPRDYCNRAVKELEKELYKIG